MDAGGRVGLELAGEPTVPEMIRISKDAEHLGIDSVWLTETRFTRDAVSTAAAIAASTTRVRVATAVINPFTRGPVLIAVTAATLDELAGGRFILGIGPGSPTVLERQGIAFDQPLTRLRETVDAVRALLRQDTVSLPGAPEHGRGAALDFAPLRKSVPIYLGVTGPRALALAGEIADGVLLNGFVSVDYTRRAVDIVRAAAAASGRDPGSVEIACSTVVSVDPNPQRAYDAARPLVATYLADFPNVAREAGVAADALDRLRTVFRRSGAVAAARLVGDEVVDALTCSGTVEHVRTQLRERRRAGVALPVLSFVESSMVSVLPDLGPQNQATAL